MIFGIITHAIHKIEDGKIYAYEPYVREMNLWAKYVDEIIILAPVSSDELTSIEIAYEHPNIKIVKIPNFDIKSIKNFLRSLLIIPKVCWLIYKVMKKSTHIHLRCPGNVALLGCLVQILFPSKQKTAKYAGNWDPNSPQPFTYKLQKKILSNLFLTKNIKTLVYGNWPNQTKNIVPFFTASYTNNEIIDVPLKDLENKINLIFVGGLTKGKQPLLSVKVAHELIKNNNNVVLNIYGDGVMRPQIENYIKEHNLQEQIFLHGNVKKDVVKKAFIDAHFLIFISKSEGWPKVVAEAMFWGCVPITSKVSCVPYMLGNNTRGQIVNSSIVSIVSAIELYLTDKKMYINHQKNAQQWSNNYTLDKFEYEISKLLDD